jgi:hypothetical protein
LSFRTTSFDTNIVDEFNFDHSRYCSGIAVLDYLSKAATHKSRLLLDPAACALSMWTTKPPATEPAKNHVRDKQDLFSRLAVIREAIRARGYYP